MNRSALLKCLGVLLLFSAGIAAADDVQMKQFVSPDGRCSVLFPGSPTYETQQVALKGGGSVTMYEWYIETANQNISYMLMYNDYPPGVHNTLDGARNGAVAGKTLFYVKPLTLNGVPGDEFSCQDSDGWNYVTRHYIMGQRLYQLIVVANKGYHADYSDAFLNSFSGN